MAWSFSVASNLQLGVCRLREAPHSLCSSGLTSLQFYRHLSVLRHTANLQGAVLTPLQTSAPLILQGRVCRRDRLLELYNLTTTHSPGSHRLPGASSLPEKMSIGYKMLLVVGVGRQSCFFQWPFPSQKELICEVP